MKNLWALGLLSCVLTMPCVAAEGDEAATLATWVALDAPTGHEGHGLKAIATAHSGWQMGTMGNLIKTTGAGGRHRVVACGIDANAFAISQITEDGYLRLHHIGRAPRNPLWSQAHEGQQVRILTNRGPVVGVTAFLNGHFINLHRDETTPTQADELWVDVGAETAVEVTAMGISLLDPVTRQIPAWSFEGQVAGPNVGQRVGCAALMAAAESGVVKDKTTWVLSTQSHFGLVGLGAALASDYKTNGSIDQVIYMGAGAESAGLVVKDGISRNFDQVLSHVGGPKVTIITPKVKNAGGLMAHMSVTDARAHFAAMMGALGGDSSKAPAWLAAPENATLLNRPTDVAQSQNPEAAFAAQLDQLAEVSAVSKNEGPVVTRVKAALPQWARDRLAEDEMGNLWLDLGPRDQKATLFMAHTDEVGYTVKSIDDDGTVHLTRMGGALGPAWEGQPALLQLGYDAETGAVQNLRGLFNSRTKVDEKWIDDITAWFGMDGATLAARGVKVGMGLTGYKEGHRVGKHRYTARGLDDRVGTTALIMALRGMKPADFKHRVVFAWSVQEEIGLNGAAAFARRFGAGAKRIYSVDTFVSSDTPLESPHFAYTPLGAGPVLRSIENSGMVMPDELARNKRIAKKAGVTAQVGQTQGGTDGTTFTYWGVPNAGLSWPGRYSHGPAELMDLRDALQLVTLIKAIAREAP